MDMEMIWKLLRFGLFGAILLSMLGFQGCSTEQKVSANAETKQDRDVFCRWMRTQFVFKDRSLDSMKNDINQTYITVVKQRYHDQAKLFSPHNETIESIFAAEIKGGQLDVIVNNDLKKNLTYIYGLLENDIPGFIDFLRYHGLESAEFNKHDQALAYKDVIKKYYGLMQLLFASPDYFTETEYLCSVANRFFEFFFRPATWDQSKKILTNPMLYPIARVFYSTMWYYLTGHGWKHWNRECLEALKKEHDLGKTIVYIASGDDVYQLFKYGIYNIEVIDPMPVQPKFCAEGWAWLIRDDGIGDKIALKFADKELELKRVEFKTHGTFKATEYTGGHGEDVQKITTRWSIYDKKTGKQLGNWVINRRFATQDDFIMNKNKALLISFNEFYFVTTMNPVKSWGIVLNQFEENFKIHIKQLRAPITKQIAQNMQVADTSQASFIGLGSQT